MFSQLESQSAYHLCWQMVHKVCSFYYKSYIFLWVHGRHRSVAKTVIIIFQCGCTVMNGVWMCMRSEHCCGPVSKRDFHLQFDSKATDCPGSYCSENIKELATVQGRGRETWSVLHFVFFLHRLEAASIFWLGFILC